LGDKLRAEWPGILQWAIDGCLAWQSQGLQTPETVRAATNGYLDDEDVIAQWIEDRCEKQDSRFTQSIDLFNDWDSWCIENREDFRTIKWFSGQLQSHGFERSRTKNGSRYRGISLK